MKEKKLITRRLSNSRQERNKARWREPADKKPFPSTRIRRKSRSR